jgi:hypothetical protein
LSAVPTQSVTFAQPVVLWAVNSPH